MVARFAWERAYGLGARQSDLKSGLLFETSGSLPVVRPRVGPIPRATKLAARGYGLRSLALFIWRALAYGYARSNRAISKRTSPVQHRSHT